MNELDDQLNKIVDRVNELENNPSELTKDALLAEIRGFYDAVKNVPFKAVSKPPKVSACCKGNSCS